MWVNDMLSKAEEGILVGFESNSRPTYTYKVYLPAKNSIVYSGDVTISEPVFHANMKFFSIEKNLLIYLLNNNNKFTKKRFSYFIFPKITSPNSK